jgi:uncharacterized protein (TIGR02246 family)
MAHEQAQSTTSKIETLVAEAQAQQLAVEPFIALHTPDAIVVNIAGRRVLGRSALQQAMAHALSTTSLSQVLTTADIDDIRFLRPDVAIVSCTKRVSDQRDHVSASDAFPTQGRLTYIVVDDGEAWRIALAQTTPIAGT